jgi:hypothetical protein
VSCSSRGELENKKLTGSARIYACKSERDPLIKEWRKLYLKGFVIYLFHATSK